MGKSKVDPKTYGTQLKQLSNIKLRVRVSSPECLVTKTGPIFLFEDVWSKQLSPREEKREKKVAADEIVVDLQI